MDKEVIQKEAVVVEVCVKARALAIDTRMPGDSQ